jgi:hypothetical protein
MTTRCMCRHERTDHAAGDGACDEIGCRCRRYVWEREHVEAAILASLLCAPGDPTVRYQLETLRADVFAVPPLRAVAEACCRLRDRHRWPAASVRPWHRVALELRLRGGPAGRRVAADGWPRALARGLGTPVGVGIYYLALQGWARGQRNRGGRHVE